jgi:cobyric acid synthase CobQ/L-threonine-O-3-phosphate decarboxylase
MGGHGGNLEKLAEQLNCGPEEILDFSANINPLGPPEYLWNVLARVLPDILHYPDPDAVQLVQAIADQYCLAGNQVVAGNGTSDLLFALLRGLAPKRAVIPVPAYIDYCLACEQAGVAVKTVLLEEKDDFQPDLQQIDTVLQAGDLLILGQPNNPTGRMNDRQTLLELADLHPDVLFLLDEAFAGFVQGYTSLAGTRENIIVLCSLTKLFAVPGLRLGFLAAAPARCRTVQGQLAPWSLNTLAQAAGTAMVGDHEYISTSQQLVRVNRQWLEKRLGRINGLRVIPSRVNFLLIRLTAEQSAAVLADRLLQEFRIAVRVCANYGGLDNRFFRVAVRSQEENRQLVTALQTILQPEGIQSKTAAKKCPALMLLGTGSDVGKSVLVAGLCRILLQDGLRVAPFKSQNMSLNSYVTRDGGEMGRAQVVQAQACRLDPDVQMNPILLKPSSDVGSQVIVLGRPVANMKVLDYVRYKETAWQQVCTTYDALAADFDCMILEGAGSPGEVNLKSHDIVNMRMAEYARAAALLVGDIDRGGVYASFVGHVEVMAPWERNLLAGFLVNRFRGDASLLDDAHTFLQERTGKPVMGVIPYLHDLGLPQEDSVSFKAGLYDRQRPAGACVEIALIDLPHISNFTDLEPLLEEPDVHLRIVRRADELAEPDCIILPGSKNVVADLAYLKKSGLDRKICRLAGQGRELVGICGGFQMLGSSITDPHGLEGEAGSMIRGLALLNLSTELAAAKTLVRREGIHRLSGQPVHGYEIHHGLSSSPGQAAAKIEQKLLAFTDGAGCGCASPEGHIWGSYLHGIFDSDPFRRWFINRLRQAKGLQPFSGEPVKYDLEPALDRLAAVMRQELDMDAVYSLLGI